MRKCAVWQNCNAKKIKNKNTNKMKKQMKNTNKLKMQIKNTNKYCHTAARHFLT